MNIGEAILATALVADIVISSWYAGLTGKAWMYGTAAVLTVAYGVPFAVLMADRLVPGYALAAFSAVVFGACAFSLIAGLSKPAR